MTFNLGDRVANQFAGEGVVIGAQYTDEKGIVRQRVEFDDSAKGTSWLGGKDIEPWRLTLVVNQLFLQPPDTTPKTYRAPTVDHIALDGGNYVASIWGAWGIAKSLPEGYLTGQNRIGWRGFSDGINFVASAERLGECKIMITYFIQQGGTGFVKIGQTNRIGKRLESLQTASPQRLEILLCLPFRLGFREEDMHYRFSSHRERGEWFRYETDLKDFVEEKIRLQKTPVDLSLSPTPDDLRAANCGGSGE
jgi:hypothetical protein